MVVRIVDSYLSFCAFYPTYWGFSWGFGKLRRVAYYLEIEFYHSTLEVE